MLPKQMGRGGVADSANRNHKSPDEEFCSYTVVVYKCCHLIF